MTMRCQPPSVLWAQGLQELVSDRHVEFLAYRSPTSTHPPSTIEGSVFPGHTALPLNPGVSSQAAAPLALAPGYQGPGLKAPHPWLPSPEPGQPLASPPPAINNSWSWEPSAAGTRLLCCPGTSAASMACGGTASLLDGWQTACGISALQEISENTPPSSGRGHQVTLGPYPEAGGGDGQMWRRVRPCCGCSCAPAISQAPAAWSPRRSGPP